MKGNYETAKQMLEADPKVTRAAIMKRLDCGELQATAFMQRFTAEQHFKKDNDDPFQGRYRYGKQPKSNRAASKKPNPVKREIVRKGDVLK